MKNLKIGARLGLGFGLVLALLLAVATIGLSRLAATQDRLQQIVDVNNRQASLAVAMRIAVNQVVAATREILLLDEPAAKQAVRAAMERSRANYDEAERRLGEMLQSAHDTSEAEKALFERTRAVRGQVRPLTDKVVALGMEDKDAEAVKLLMTEVKPLQQKWFEALGELAAKQEADSAEAAATAASSYRAARLLMAGCTLLAVAMGAGAAVLITRSISRPIAQAVRFAQTVAAGDLSTRIDTSARDETGDLLRALAGMNDSLVRIVGQVRASSDSIATGSAQISSGSADLSQRTEEQASNLEQTASSMEQMSATVKQNAETVRSATEVAGCASAAAVKGGEVVGQVVSTMQEINTSSKKIADIISVIDGIAFQTNILALNAAVEAARAGEQGRGFAVVAGEVRSLAQRSAEAAREIKALIGESVVKVENGHALVGQAGEAMDDIVRQVQRVSQLINEIGTATTEQSQGIQQVAQAVTQLDDVTQQNAALVEQSTAAADSLKQQASRLVDAVSVFRLSPAPSL